MMHRNGEYIAKREVEGQFGSGDIEIAAYDDYGDKLLWITIKIGYTEASTCLNKSGAMELLGGLSSLLEMIKTEQE